MKKLVFYIKFDKLFYSEFIVNFLLLESCSFYYNFVVSYVGFPGGSVKNPPAGQETWVRSLGWEDPLEEGMATQPSVLAWRILMDQGAWWATVQGVAKSWTRLSD